MPWRCAPTAASSSRAPSGNSLAAAAFTRPAWSTLTFGTAGRIVKGLGNSSVGSAVAFDSQGRAVIGGTSVVVTTVSTHYAYAVRIGASQVDATFGTNQTFRGANGGEDVRGVTITAGDGMVFSVASGNDHRFIRLDQSGVPDTTFGTMGTATVANVGGDPSVSSLSRTAS